MAQVQGITLTTARKGRLGLFWGLLAAVFLAVVGLASPGPPCPRPPVEYSEPSQTAANAARLHVVAAVDQQAVGHFSPPTDTPQYAISASISPKSGVRHTYQATGPPIVEPSQPA